MSIYLPGPPGLDWAGARTKVRGDLWRPGNSLPDDQVDRALHAALLQLEGETKWLWLEDLTVLTTPSTLGQSFIDLPASIGRVTSIGIRRDTFLDPMREIPLQEVRRLADSSLGDPCSWALTSGRIYFDATLQPGTELELVITATTPERLEDAIDSGSYTLQLQQQPVLALACAMIALNFMKNEAEAARQQAVYDTVLERLLNVEAERRGANIQPDTWGMGQYG